MISIIKNKPHRCIDISTSLKVKYGIEINFNHSFNYVKQGCYGYFKYKVLCDYVVKNIAK